MMSTFGKITLIIIAWSLLLPIYLGNANVWASVIAQNSEDDEPLIDEEAEIELVGDDGGDGGDDGGDGGDDGGDGGDDGGDGEVSTDETTPPATDETTPPATDGTTPPATDGTTPPATDATTPPATDGTTTTTAPDGTITVTAPDGTITVTAPDGTITTKAPGEPPTEAEALDALEKANQALAKNPNDVNALDR